ncbi:aminotransferase [Aestuariibius sp. HNIBRBA575]|uniref:aminotransferase n=1 Tax=Aestuariibius sp. HNIBRBA575 TaxID=3233343 RepID=UPI0034A45220
MSRTKATFLPPVMEARRWLEGVDFSDRPLINVSQAAPVDPPPQQLRQAIADVALNVPDAHLYGPVLGLPALKSELATQWSAAYQGSITADQVGITSGCNQAFSATISMLCDQDDEVILPIPYYFNHRMWLDMQGVKTVPLQTGPDMLPDPAYAGELITPRTRAIALVTPNNPCGVEYPAELVRAFYNLCQDRGIALILDETYRDFDSRTGAPHDLFADPNWADTLIHLYSFSKAYRLTGHRVGAMVSSVARLEEAEKFLDTVAICPNQIGQYAALWGMQNLGAWVSGERDEILDRRAAIAEGFPTLEQQGWKLRGLGAYFAYLEHPFAMDSDDLARELVKQAGILVLPGTMFTPDGDADGKRQIRIAFANVDRAGITELFTRLAGLNL